MLQFLNNQFILFYFESSNFSVQNMLKSIPTLTTVAGKGTFSLNGTTLQDGTWGVVSLDGAILDVNRKEVELLLSKYGFGGSSTQEAAGKKAIQKIKELQQFAASIRTNMRSGKFSMDTIKGLFNRFENMLNS